MPGPGLRYEKQAQELINKLGGNLRQFVNDEGMLDNSVELAKLWLLFAKLCCGTQFKLNFHARSFSSIRLANATIIDEMLSANSLLLNQLIALNQLPLLHKMFAPEGMFNDLAVFEGKIKLVRRLVGSDKYQLTEDGKTTDFDLIKNYFPALVNGTAGLGVLHDVLAKLIKTYGVDEQSEIHDRLWQVIEIFRGETDTNVREHFDEAMTNEALQIFVCAKLQTLFDRVMSEATATAEIDKIVKFTRKIHELVPLSVSRFKLITSIRETDPQKSDPEKSSNPAIVRLGDSSKEAIRILYANIVTAHEQGKEFAVIGYQRLLDLVRLDTAGNLSTDFKNILKDADIKQALIYMFKAELTDDMSIIVANGDVARLEFWKVLFATLPQDSLSQSVLLGMVIGQQKHITMKLSEEVNEQTYGGWIDVLCAYQNYNWDDINIDLLLELMRLSADITTSYARHVLESLFKAINEGKHYDKLFGILATLVSYPHQAERVCISLFFANLLNKVFAKALEERHLQAMIALLQPAYIDRLYPSVYGDVDVIISLLLEFLASRDAIPSFLAQLRKDEEVWENVRSRIIARGEAKIIQIFEYGRMPDEELIALMIEMMERDLSVFDNLYPENEQNEIGRQRLASASAIAKTNAEFVVYEEVEPKYELMRADFTPALTEAIQQNNWAKVVEHLKQNMSEIRNPQKILELLDENKGYLSADPSTIEAIQRGMNNLQQQKVTRLVRNARSSLRASQRRVVASDGSISAADYSHLDREGNGQPAAGVPIASHYSTAHHETKQSGDSGYLGKSPSAITPQADQPPSPLTAGCALLANVGEQGKKRERPTPRPRPTEGPAAVRTSRTPSP